MAQANRGWRGRSEHGPLGGLLPIASIQSQPAAAHRPLNQQPLPASSRRPHSAVLTLRPRISGARAWLRAVRVRQWTKNLLVLAAPAAAGVLGQPSVLWRALVTVVAFCALASGAYLINDVRDAPEDRRHPTKRHRPIASGAVPTSAALPVGLGLMVIGLGISLVISIGLLTTACGYVALNAAYTGLFRRVPVADIVAIGGAFVIRALAGAVAVQVPISGWFIVFVSWGALFVAAGKRYADYLDPAARKSRRVLQRYSAEFLRVAIAVSCALALATYVMWAFQTASPGGGPWRKLTVIPLLLVVLRYRTVAIRGAGGAPERVLFSDHFLQLAGAIWLATFALGV